MNTLGNDLRQRKTPRIFYKSLSHDFWYREELLGKKTGNNKSHEIVTLTRKKYKNLVFNTVQQLLVLQRMSGAQTINRPQKARKSYVFTKRRQMRISFMSDGRGHQGPPFFWPPWPVIRPSKELVLWSLWTFYKDDMLSVLALFLRKTSGNFDSLRHLQCWINDNFHTRRQKAVLHPEVVSKPEIAFT